MLVVIVSGVTPPVGLIVYVVSGMVPEASSGGGIQGGAVVHPASINLRWLGNCFSSSCDIFT